MSWSKFNACTMFNVVYRLCDLIPICSPSHAHNTRNKQLLMGKKHKLKSTSFSVTYRGPQIWNKLEVTTKMSSSLSVFKKSLKQQLVLKYIQSNTSKDQEGTASHMKNISKLIDLYRYFLIAIVYMSVIFRYIWSKS